MDQTTQSGVPLEVEPTDTDYVGPDSVTAKLSEEHQRQDVAQLESDVAKIEAGTQKPPPLL